MLKNFTRFPSLFRLRTTAFIKKFCFLPVWFLFFTSCTWSTGVFEKNQLFQNQEWPSSLKPDIRFDMKDTVNLYNIYIVVRHTDAYHFNNMYIRVTVKAPGEREGKSGDYDLQLATNSKGWIGTAMDDIYDARLLIQPKTRFPKTGTYQITLEQLMREDPLKSVLSAGLRVERVQ